VITIKKYYFHCNDNHDKYYVYKSHHSKKSHDCYCNHDSKKSHDCYCNHDSEKSHDCYCNHKKDDCKKENTRESAFRAINLVNQTVPANTFVKVLYQFEEFDLANEYNPANSTFIPKKRGVYSVLGTISFSPNNINQAYRTRIEIRVNGNPAVAIDNDFFGAGQNFANAVNVSTILELEAGDRVEIFAQNSTAGVIRANDNGVVSTHFEAARFPSPAE
jgi:hypothetical protein